MVISINGKVRRRTRLGKGLFRIERWNESPFSIELDAPAIASGLILNATQDVEFHCESQNGRVFVRAEVRKKHFIIGEVVANEAKVLSFSILTVAGIEVIGRLKSLGGN